MIQEVDTESGTIDFEEFVQMMQVKLQEVDVQEEIIEAFRVFDKERTGFIPRTELKTILVSMGETMTDEEAEDLLQEAPANPEGNIDYISFVKTLFEKL